MRAVKIAIIKEDMPDGILASRKGFLRGLEATGVRYSFVEADAVESPGNYYSENDLWADLKRYSDVKIVYRRNGNSFGAVDRLTELRNYGENPNDRIEWFGDLLSDESVWQAAVKWDSYMMECNAMEELVKMIRDEKQPTGEWEIVPGVLPH